MVDTSNQIGQLRQWFFVGSVLLLTLATACSGNARDAINGQYRINESAHLSAAQFESLRPKVKRSVLAFAALLSRSVVYEFGSAACARHINGQRYPFLCEFVRVEKRRVVVFRSEDEMGRPRFLRLTPTDTGVILDDGERQLPLERIDT